ncbi:MAG: hypothetical protein KAH22_09030 [Thiotrichaceae bacterium]|nr:hypothetical protein [Thiotrichaceae bacterium]
METVYLFITEILIGLTLSGISLLILSKPLVNILDDLCPTRKQAEFWLAYTRIMLCISPLLLILIIEGFVKSDDLLVHVRVALLAGLGGLLLGMLIVGQRVYIPVSQRCDIPQNAGIGK